MTNNVHGILLLDKASGLTSNHALQRVKRLFGAKKAGHTGSLDPIATGMLPICFGEATKFSQYLLDSDKQYEVTAQLGIETTTGDCEGEVRATYPISGISQKNLCVVLSGFIGEMQQIPPMYSALKYQGQPLYRLARQGIEVERSARTIHIYSIEFLGLNQDLFDFHVHCSKGTYIRTLVEDIGKKLGCGAHVRGLRRSSVSSYQKASMYSFSALEDICRVSGLTGLRQLLLPVDSAVRAYPSVVLSASAAFYLHQGQAVRTSSLGVKGLVRLFLSGGTFIGMGEMTEDGGVKPCRLSKYIYD